MREARPPRVGAQPCLAPGEPQDGDAGGDLVADDDVDGPGEEDDGERDVDHAEVGAEGVGGAEEGARQPVAVDGDGDGAVARLREAVRGVVMRRVDVHVVPAGAQRHGRVDDEPLGAANAQVRVHERHADHG